MRGNEFLDVVREATSGSSEVIELNDQSSVARMRGRASTASIETPVVQMRLADVDGFLEWEEATGAAPELNLFRGPATSSENATLELKFDRLPPSAVTGFLEKRDATLTPSRGLRRYDPVTRTLADSIFPVDGEALILVHGTFSKGENILSGFFETKQGGAFLTQACERYRGNVFTFDHPTLSVSPILNAIDLQRILTGSRARIRLVSHSRGGLVARWWCETFDPLGDRCDRAVLVGSPLAGTGLAAPPNIRQTIHLLTQLSKALQVTTGLTALAVPVFSVVEALLRVVTSITGFAAKTPAVDAAMAMVPGLFAMSRVGNNPELGRLLAHSERPERYFGVESNFEPSAPGWRFWRHFRPANLADHATDVLFDGANDLVVDTPSMSRLTDETRIAPENRLDFGTSETVHHLNYFSQPQTIEFLADTLLSSRSG
ncbi:MAG: hypothetical protein AAFX06_05780 [Planctomycetota bacterium]